MVVDKHNIYLNSTVSYNYIIMYHNNLVVLFIRYHDNFCCIIQVYAYRYSGNIE